MQLSQVSRHISVALQRRNKLLPLAATFSVDPISFADNGQLRRLDSIDWQIIFGRRGAGKTMLLARYAKYITSNMNKDEASVEINVPSFTSKVTKEDKLKTPDEELAQIYFSDFIRLISEHLFKVFSEENKESKFLRIFEKSDKKKTIHDKVLEIHQSTVAEEALDIGRLRNVKKKKLNELKRGSEIKSNLAAGGSLSRASADVSISGSFKGENYSALDNTDRLEEEFSATNFKFDYGKTRRLIEDLLDLLEIKRLYIFLDEWSYLDPTASTEVQPYFADLLKAIFWRNDRFIIKIAATRNQTRLISGDQGRSIGLLLSNDIFAIDLDSIYSGQDLDKNKFFEELIFRHLLFCNEKLSMFQKPGEHDIYGTLYSSPVETFITHIFKSKEVFYTLISGSGAVPRDFIEILDSIAHTKHYSVDTLWGMRDVKQAIRNHFVLKKQPEYLSSKTVIMYNKMIVKIKENDSRIILVEKTSSKELLAFIFELYNLKFVHDISPVNVPALIRSRFYFFYADLGMQFDIDGKKIDEVVQEDFSIDNINFPTEIGRFILG